MKSPESFVLHKDNESYNNVPGQEQSRWISGHKVKRAVINTFKELREVDKLLDDLTGDIAKLLMEGQGSERRY